MSLSVSEVLDLMKKRNAKDEDNLFSNFVTGFFISNEPTECACVALKKMEVTSTMEHSCENENTTPKKVVAVLEAFSDFDYYKCLTVGEFRKFLECVEDKSIPVCIISPKDIEEGWLLGVGVVDAYPANSEDDFPDEKLRQIFGENIFHLWI